MEAVHRIAILDSDPEERFDVLTRQAVEKLNVAISMVSIIDHDREWFKSCTGLNQKEGERVVSFCAHALLAKVLFVVENTLEDERFHDNPMVVGFPFIRFYAGMALFDYKTRQPIGVFCVKDTKPRKLRMEETAIIVDLADQAEKEINK